VIVPVIAVPPTFHSSADATAGATALIPATAAMTIAFFIVPNILLLFSLCPATPGGCGTEAPSLEPWDDSATALHRDLSRNAEKGTTSVIPRRRAD
jgi:hypothetical protein